ncbi:hypothetical protein [uncultured Dialister sp.]|uniref:hypothetical protein n=1 Tax=Dialister succinatiphilus TaxID=487173 RepID=UPI0026704406|nr:hypothetical protein [uncultured Dialister sp.]
MMKKRKGCFYLLGTLLILIVILLTFYEYNAPAYPKGRQTVVQVSHDGRFQLDGGDPLLILQDVKYGYALDRSVFAFAVEGNRLYFYGASGFIVIDEKEDHIYCLPVYRGNAKAILSLQGYGWENNVYGNKFTYLGEWEEFSENDKKALSLLVSSGETRRLATLLCLRNDLDYLEKRYDLAILEGKDISDKETSINELKNALSDEDLFIPTLLGL